MMMISFENRGDLKKEEEEEAVMTHVGRCCGPTARSPARSLAP